MTNAKRCWTGSANWSSWSRDTVATAMRLVAELNANVKGAVADADYALESAVRQVAELVADRGR